MQQVKYVRADMLRAGDVVALPEHGHMMVTVERVQLGRDLCDVRFLEGHKRMRAGRVLRVMRGVMMDRETRELITEEAIACAEQRLDMLEGEAPPAHWTDASVCRLDEEHDALERELGREPEPEELALFDLELAAHLRHLYHASHERPTRWSGSIFECPKQAAGAALFDWYTAHGHTSHAEALGALVHDEELAREGRRLRTILGAECPVARWSDDDLIGALRVAKRWLCDELERAEEE